MKSHSGYLAFALALTMGGLLVAGGCSRKPAPVQDQALPAVAVRTAPVQLQRRLATEEVVGTVRPKLSATLAAKLSGTVQQMLVVPGQAVKAGELLVQIDAREIQARLDQALAIRDQAQKDLERLGKLLEQKILTQQEYDAVQSRFRVADGAVREAETMLGYTKVLAPFDGVVTAKRADVGDLAAPGRPLVDIENPVSLRLEADVPEALIEKIKLNDKLPVRVPTANLALEAAVGEIAPAADAASRTFRVKLDLPQAPGLRSGQFGRVAVPVAEVAAIRVPVGAVLVRGQMELAFVAVQGRAQMRLVKTGKYLGSEIEIVSGLNPGEQLVVEGAARLLDGQPVSTQPK